MPGLVGEARDENATGVVTLVAAVEEEGGLQCTSNNHSIPSSEPAVLTQPCSLYLEATRHYYHHTWQ